MEKDDKNTTDKNVNKEEEDIQVNYGYWKRESDLIDRDKFIPKIIEDPDKLVLENKNSLGSAWNTAGTWEEKHYKMNNVEEFLNNQFKSKSYPGLSFSEVKGMTGDVYTVIVRKTAKLVYDVNFKMTVTNDKGESGELELNDVNNHDLNAEFEFEYKKMSSDLKNQIKTNKKELEGLIKEQFQEFWQSQKK